MNLVAKRGVLAVWFLSIGLLIASCGGDADTETAATCTISESELGPFGPDQPIGSTLGDAEARARKAETGFDSWIRVDATGGWQASWDVATSILGNSIHTDLTWLDVNGEITGLYAPDDRFEFADLRVSRSFQGKIEHSDESLFFGVVEADGVPDYENASCAVTSIDVADKDQASMLDVLEVEAAS